MNKGVIFFIVIVIAILALIFIPGKKDQVNAPVEEAVMSEDLQGSVIEATTEAEVTTEVVETTTEVEATTEVAQ